VLPRPWALGPGEHPRSTKVHVNVAVPILSLSPLFIRPTGFLQGFRTVRQGMFSGKAEPLAVRMSVWGNNLFSSANFSCRMC